MAPLGGTAGGADGDSVERHSQLQRRKPEATCTTLIDS